MYSSGRSTARISPGTGLGLAALVADAVLPEAAVQGVAWAVDEDGVGVGGVELMMAQP